jgi:hypothetical protein
MALSTPQEIAGYIAKRALAYATAAGHPEWAQAFSQAALTIAYGCCPHRHRYPY